MMEEGEGVSEAEDELALMDSSCPQCLAPENEFMEIKCSQQIILYYDL